MKVLVDNEISGRLATIHEAVELRDSGGRTYGYFHPATTPVPPAIEHLRSPISDEELARRLASPGG